MRLVADKILVRFSKESIEALYMGKEIERVDGSKVRLFITVPFDMDDDRRAGQTVQTAMVTGVGPKSKGVKRGDIAIVNYDLFNMMPNMVGLDEEGATMWLHSETTYHVDDLVVHANRQSARTQIVHQKNDYEEISLLLGLVRGDKLLARSPFVFFEHESPDVHKETPSGIIYTEHRRYFERRILGISEDSTDKFGVQEGDKVMVYESDIFEIKLGDKSIDCAFDIDLALKM
jgi:hypothetical protein